MKKTLTTEAKNLLNEALYLRLEQNGTNPQQKNLLNSLIKAMGEGSGTDIQWICK
tara:strand:- start:1493 stop:1657 length:165 start_codon:yes stop_codon:yes gene_type:complete